MTYTRLLKQLTFLLVLCLSVPRGHSQSLYDTYDFSNGIDMSLWEDMSDATTLNLSGDDNAYTTPIPIGFDFNLAGTDYQNWTINTNGTIRLGDTPISHAYYNYPLGTNLPYNLPKIVVLGGDGYIVQGSGYVKYKTIGSTSEDHLLIIEYKLSTFSLNTRDHPVTVQIQLRESDSSITLVFGEPPQLTPEMNYQMGVAVAYDDLVEFNVTTNAANFLTGPTSFVNPSGQWPEENRYYRIYPNHSNCPSVTDITVENIDANSATIRWALDNNHNLYRVCVEGMPCQIVNGDHIDLTGLEDGSTYNVYIRRICSDDDSSRARNIQFRTHNIPAHGCINHADLGASYVTGYYGGTNDPYAYTGIINHGSSSESSRHTLHTDPNELDPQTHSQLHTVPPGYSSSVRLGNWLSGGQAEALLYEMEVDTTIADLLLLHYAAVLENPSHYPNQQPRFKFEILNSNMQVIDAECGVADFIANSNLGWHEAGRYVLWKDWTTIGIDLTPYAGQIISIRFTTYDCSQGGHYGYAYFTLECGRKNTQTESCGNILSNTYTVPAGFNYLWYTESPSNPVSTSRSLNIVTDTNTIYHCRLSFVDKPQCNFTMNVATGKRYPLSLFDTTMFIDNCQFNVNFHNRSTISSDGITPSGSGERCETTWWDFGNGDTSSRYNGSTHYDTPGTYTVTLISTIANGACADTLQMPVTLTSPAPVPVIVGPTEHCDNNLQTDTLLIHNTLWNSNGSDTLIVNTVETTTYTITATDSINCPYTLEHTITIHPSYYLHDTATICPPDLPYTHDNLIITDISDTGSYSFEAFSIFGCDSIGTVFLTVKDTNSGDTVAVACDRFTWYGETFTSDGDVATHVSANAAGCDSITTLRLTLLRSSDTIVYDTIVENQLPYTFNGATFNSPVNDSSVIIPNAAGCDSIISYSLYVHWNVDSVVYDTLCNDALPYVWNGIEFDTTLTQTATLTRNIGYIAHTGADSTFIMRLTIHPLYDNHLYVDICEDTNFLFGDSLYTLTGEYLDSRHSIHGCDSLVTLHLTRHPTFDNHTYDTICSNQSITFADETYNTSGVYPHSLLSTYNCDSIASLHLHVWPAYDNHTYDTLCDDTSRFFIDSVYHQTGTYLYLFSSVNNCDSTESLHLKVYPTYDLHLYDTIYDGDRYTFEGTVYDTTGNYSTLLTATFGCDSLRTLHLQRNRRTYNDSTLCQNGLPLVWNGITFKDRKHTGNVLILSDSIHLNGIGGIDSLVVMTLYVHDTSSITEQIHACDSLCWQDSITYTKSTTLPFITLTNAAKCDSVIHLDLTIDYTQRANDQQETCDSLLWVDSRHYYRDTIGPMDTLVTIAGCDSIVTLYLVVNNSSYEEAIDTFCHGQTYLWRQHSIGNDDAHLTVVYYLTDTLRSAYNCDSVLAIRLTQMARPQIDFSYGTDCNLHIYNVSVTSDVDYIRWSSFPYDSLLDGHESQPSIVVSPNEPTEYALYADYREIPFCPTTASLRLQPIEIPQAILQVNPEALKYNAMEFTAYDISKEYSDRTWYIDGIRQSETSRMLYGHGDTDVDTIAISLSVFNGQCHDTAVYLLPVLRVAVFAPNAFTPSCDDNNRFTLVTQGVIDGELYIYNREGILVYQTTDFGQRGWDGGTCPQGGYVWKFIYRAIDYPDSKQEEVGTVLLLR